MPHLALRAPARALVALAVALCALALGAASASAKPGQLVLFDGGSQLMGSQQEATLDELDGLGVKALRVVVSWHNVAPQPDSRVRPPGDLTDPAAYTWGGYGQLVDEARDRGWKVVLTLANPAPRWATEGAAADGVTRPRPADYEHFFTAAGRRFGSEATWWSVWNEPNLYKFLMPQFSGGKPAAPGIYRKLYAAARTGLDKAGEKNAKMLFGEFAPRGNNQNVAPLTFLRDALCLSKSYKKVGSCKPLKIDGIAHHPYQTTAGPFFVPPANKPDDVTMGALSRLRVAMDKAAKAKVLKKKLPIFLTEYGVQSYPDRSLGVPLDKQSDYRSLAERLAWGEGRVAAFSQYLMTDDKPSKDGGRTIYPGFESGLRTYLGKQKPVYESFRLPLSALKVSRTKVSLWGLVRPATKATRVTIERTDTTASKFRKVLSVRTKADGSWTASTAAGGSKRTWRVVWTDAAGDVFRGPPTKAYTDPR